MARYAVQHRRGTLAQWIDKGFIPLAGELVVEIDEVNNLHKLKTDDSTILRQLPQQMKKQYSNRVPVDYSTGHAKE